MDKKISKLEDLQIVQQLQAQFDSELFAELLRRYEPKALARAKSYLKDEEQAKDIVQEVFIKVYLQIGQYKGEAGFQHWLLSIVNNMCIDFLRREKKRLHQLISEELSDTLSDLSELEEELSEELSQDILEQLLEQIPPEDKMILLMKYKENTRIKDIQQLLNLSESAVKMRIKRARSKITALHKSALKK